MQKLFQALTEPGFIPLRNRLVMSAMSRSFADADRCPTEEMVRYYERRAQGGAGLILTEGTIIHSTGDGWVNAPYIAEDRHARAWRPVIDAVHAADGAIACQLWHMGRISHEDFTGGPPVSATARAAAGHNRQNDKPFGTPRALDAAEMPQIYAQFVTAAQRALDAGFDAVELHMGHGYLPDQFLDGQVNDRTDQYGGSVENRCRFALELVEAVTKAVPGRQVMARISPSRFMGGLYEWPDLDEMIGHLTPALSELGLGGIDVSCANSDYFATAGRMVRKIRPLYTGVIVSGASLTPEQAEAELQSGMVDAITWGRAFIANPDLAERIRTGADLVPFDDSMRATLI
ncbi:alkene reductase [Sphingomonas sp.]|jgi:2,4-dienoyl-CoA reductase-like NADH-dependent reductase (Old Yellow Enzyme family)|uniref:oxidoreductase n=1 Tax=Sphingomonas sp. TaxID=28214 RepID=UPI002E11604F|nr:alkene reductase [Sphingomonas sp.]